MNILKSFIFIYAIFTLFTLLLGLNSGAQYLKIETPSEWNLITIAQFIGNLFVFVGVLFVYSTGYFIIDVILWAYRIAAIFELALYFKQLFNPVAN